MDFEFSDAEQEFVAKVEQFLDANRDPEVMDVTRENMAQICRHAEAPRVHEEGRRGRAGSA